MKARWIRNAQPWALLVMLLVGQALQAMTVEVLNQPTGELTHVQELTLPVQMEGTTYGDWQRLDWSLQLNGNPHMPIDIIDVSEAGKLVFKLNREVQNGTYQILVRSMSPPGAKEEVVATLRVNVPAARNRPLVVDEKIIVDQSRLQIHQKIKMDITLRTFEHAQEYQRRMQAGESKTRPAEEQKAMAALGPMLEQQFLAMIAHLEQLERSNDLVFLALQTLDNRTQAEAMVGRLKILINHLEGLKLALRSGCYGTLYLNAAVKERFDTLMARHPEALAEAIERKRQDAERKARDQALQEAVAARRAERERVKREEKKVRQEETKEVERQRAEVEGTLRVPSLEEELAEKDWREEERKDYLRSEADRRAGRLPGKSSSSSSSLSSSSSRSSSAQVPSERAVRWHEDAKIKDLARVPEGPMREAVQVSVTSLRETGRLRGSKPVAPGIYELRPSGGQSTWRPLYALHEDEFVILAVAKEAIENPARFDKGRKRAIRRLEQLRVEPPTP